MTRHHSTGPRKPTTSELCFLTATTMDLLKSSLEEFLRASGARAAMIVDRTGCIAACVGDMGPLSTLETAEACARAAVALAALVDRTATRELSLGFFGSELDGLHLALLDERFTLAVAVDRRTEATALREGVRIFMNRVVPHLEEDLSRRRKGRMPAPPPSPYAHNFSDEEISSLFADPPED